MEGQGVGGNFFKRYWIAVVAIGVAVLLGIGIGVYFTVGRSRPVKENATRKVALKEEKSESAKDEKQEEPQDRSERFAFVMGDWLRGDIYLSNREGSGLKRITDRGDIVEFDVTESGDKFAYTVIYNTANTEEPGPLYVLQTNENREKCVFKQNGWT